MSVMKTYLAGPMTGIPQFNYPQFLRVSEILREEGWDIHNPVEMDDPAVFEQAWESQDGTFDGTVGGLTWGEILGKDVQYLSDDCDSLVTIRLAGVSGGFSTVVLNNCVTSLFFSALT